MPAHDANASVVRFGWTGLLLTLCPLGWRTPRSVAFGGFLCKNLADPHQMVVYMNMSRM